MQLQCSSVSGAFRQYSLQYLLPAGTVQSQLGWAHLGCGFVVGSGMASPAFFRHHAPIRR